VSNWLAVHPGTAFVLALVLVAVTGGVDYLTGFELSFSLFYLAPVMLAAWFSGARATAAVVVLSACTWLVADLTAGHVYSREWIPVWNSLIRLAVFVLTALLLRTLRAALMAEQRLADSDPLTGLANRRAFCESLEQELARAARYGEAVTVAYFDLDNFKQVNDSMGHDTGDDLLRRVATTLRDHVRATDVVARLGGDEFALLYPRADYTSAARGLQKLREQLLAAMRERAWPVTFSIGALSYARPAVAVRECLAECDALMYQVKRHGKNDLVHERR
jgi:diguanylate cyclase (GGDEF)-like protein